jgi:hypothetical protein
MCRAIDLLVHMSDEGMLPDNAMLSSVAKALAGSLAVDALLVDGDPRCPLPSPASVWSLTDHQWRQLQSGAGSIHRRKLYGSTNSYVGRSPMTSVPVMSSVPSIPSVGASAASGTLAPPQINGESSESFVNWLLGPTTVKMLHPAPSTPPPAGRDHNSSSSVRFSTPTRQSREGPNVHPKRLSERLYTFPELEWVNFESPDRKPLHVVSSKLRRHMVLSEEMLLRNFPGLKVDLDNAVGMSCPGVSGKQCPVNRAQSLREIYSGWDADPNKYTCRCFACGREFVPRFTVESTGEKWVGSEGPGTALWCELLSPWTLRKELFNIIIQEGVELLLSANFRMPLASNPQHSVLFWNSVIAFRLFGLPFSFLLVGNSGIQEAFPPKPSKQHKS